MPVLRIPQKKLELTVPEGKNLMDALIEAGLPVASSCLGEGICSKCAVKQVPRGNPNQLEIQTMERNHQPQGLRLSCQVNVTEDLSVETSYW